MGDPRAISNDLGPICRLIFAVAVGVLLAAGQTPPAVAEILAVPQADATKVAGVTASFLRRWSKRLVQYPINLGLPAYQSKRGPITVNGAATVNSSTTTSTAGNGSGGGGRFASSGSPDISHTAGYFKLNRTHDAHMFFFYFESRGNKNTDPLVLWTNGGPGCSSSYGLFFENGPYKINNDNKTLSWNDYGWDLVSNIIYVDQPINTGFSYSSDPRDTRRNEDGVAQDMYEFMQAFLSAHPELRDRPFYITGESYGGHYQPSMGLRMHQANQRNEGLHINLKGIAIGNGWTQPDIQFGSSPAYALSEKLISQQQYNEFMVAYTPCKLAVKACGQRGLLSCRVAFAQCETFQAKVFRACGSGNLNIYDVRQDCVTNGPCDDDSAIGKYLNQQEVRAALGVGDRTWEVCSNRVYLALLLDVPRNIQPRVVKLLEANVRMLLYSGDKDFICNWMGNSWWVSAMKWSGRAKYNSTSWTPFTVDGAEKGSARVAEPLSFLRVYDAGHMVPTQQPKASLEMLRRFINGLSVS